MRLVLVAMRGRKRARKKILFDMQSVAIMAKAYASAAHGNICAAWDTPEYRALLRADAAAKRAEWKRMRRRLRHSEQPPITDVFPRVTDPRRFMAAIDALVAEVEADEATARIAETA